jgi:hypothetical protein
LRFGIAIHPEQAPEIYLEGATLRHATLSREHHGPRAVLNAVERVASDTDARRLAVRSELVLAEGQLRDYQERLGKPFPHHAYQADLTELRDRLKLALSATISSATTPSEPGTEPTITALELADLIRALKDKQTLDSPPQAARLGTRSPTAERPVTARIRERREESLSTVSISDGDPPPSTSQPEADLPIEGRFALNPEATSSA